MMDAIAGYLMRLVCGSMVCGLILSITGTDGPSGTIRRMLCGLFLTYLAISPIADLDFKNLRYTDPGITKRASELAQAGEASAKETMAQIIKDQCSAYIQNKAEELSLSVTAEITLEPESGIPVAVRISGSAAPYDREELIGYITRTLGVERSGIHWQTETPSP